ncbi:hypothetical protein F6Y24_18835 [Xanthomonas arboricola pv. pruni]|nr:hypothetical protein F6Y24_18835 [Xanthomonas arboricola pv. pruni]RST70446.1 hypothetical protein EJK96_08615 [Xanthomonas arboricola pv. pruni]RST74712.1 hypothetical protein EJL05_19175 [Xanthomonas arboricola pv. pruni]
MGARALERPHRKRGPGRGAGVGVRVWSEAPVALGNAWPPDISHAARRISSNLRISTRRHTRHIAAIPDAPLRNSVSLTPTRA